MSSGNDCSDQSKDAIGQFINLEGNLKTTVKKLKKNKPNQQPAEIVFEGFHEIVKGIKQDQKRNQIDQSQLKQNGKNNKGQRLSKPKQAGNQDLNPKIERKGIQILHFLNKIKNDVEDVKKDKQAIKNQYLKSWNDSNQKPKQKKKHKQNKRRKEKNIPAEKEKKPKQKSENKKKQRNKVKQNLEQKRQSKQCQSPKRKKKIEYAPYDSVEPDFQQNQKSTGSKQNVFDYFKKFQEEQKIQLKQQQKMKKLEEELTKREKQVTKAQTDKTKPPKKPKQKKQKAQNPSKSSKKTEVQRQKEQQINSKNLKSQPLPKEKQMPKPLLPMKLGKGKKQRIDPRKQTLKQIIDTYNNKLKSKELNTRIFTNLFGNQIEFAIAYETKKIDSSYFLKCILTPLDHRAVSIILTHKFPKQFFIDETQPFPQQPGIPDQLFIFYENLYSLTQIEYYTKYLQTVLFYKRKSARSLRITLDSVMKQKLKTVSSIQQKKERKNIQQLLQRIDKSEKEEQLMNDIRRQNQIKLQTQNQQRKYKGNKKGAEIKQNPQLPQQSVERERKVSKKERNTNKQKKLQPSAQDVEPKRRVIVIDEREQSQDSSQLDCSASSYQQSRDSYSSRSSASRKSQSSQSQSQRKVESDSDQDNDDQSGEKKSNNVSQSHSQKQKSGNVNSVSGQSEESEDPEESQDESGFSQSFDMEDENLDSQKHKRQSDGSLSMGSDLNAQKSQESNQMGSLSSPDSNRSPSKNKRRSIQISDQSAIESSESIKISMDDGSD